MSNENGYGHELAPRAKELTMQEIKQRHDDAHALNEAIKGDISDARTAGWSLAAHLDLFDEMVGWSALGFDSQNAWLADPDIGMTRTTYHRLVDSYRFLVLHEVEAETIRELEVSKVDVVLPAVRQGRAKLDDALDDVRTLGKRDLREQYRDPAAKEDDSTGPTGGTGPIEGTGDGDPGLAPQNPTDDTPIRASDVGKGKANAVEPEPAFWRATVHWVETEDEQTDKLILRANEALHDLHVQVINIGLVPRSGEAIAALEEIVCWTDDFRRVLLERIEEVTG